MPLFCGERRIRGCFHAYPVNCQNKMRKPEPTDLELAVLIALCEQVVAQIQCEMRVRLARARLYWLSGGCSHPSPWVAPLGGKLFCSICTAKLPIDGMDGN